MYETRYFILQLDLFGKLLRGGVLSRPMGESKKQKDALEFYESDVE